MCITRGHYQAMRNMIYGNIPEFEDILVLLEKLQEEIHGLEYWYFVINR